MDANVKKTAYGTFYKLVNRETGKVEYSSTSRIQARNEENMLWARGVKVDFVEAIIDDALTFFPDVHY